MGVVYVSESDDDQALLTAEIPKCPESVPEDVRVYVERIFRTIRDDLMRSFDGTWRLIVVDDHLEFHQYNATTGTWLRKYRIREDAT